MSTKATVDSSTNTWLNRSTQIPERLLACLHDAGPFPKENSTVDNSTTVTNCSWRVSLNLNANEKMGNFYGIAKRVFVWKQFRVLKWIVADVL